MTAPSDWLLHFTSNDYGSALGDGRPWGDGTEMAARADPKNPLHRDPWDPGCTVTPILGGHPAMNEYRKALDEVIDKAEKTAGLPYQNGAWQRGHVYIVDWRFNCLRDLSDSTEPWTGSTADVPEDATAIGLIRRLMQAGVQVRLMVWYPTTTAALQITAGLGAHIEDHHYAAVLVQAENQRLMAQWGVPADADPLGAVALDMRTAQGRSTGSMHQKMMVIRTPTMDKAFAGGVDLAYTRRDAPLTYGDWQSGGNMPHAGPAWPRPKSADPARYASVATATPQPTTFQGSDLPATDAAGLTLFGPRQSWHDHHLMLTGPVVATLESQFVERWVDTTPSLFSLAHDDTHISPQQVLFSTPGAMTGFLTRTIRPLPKVTPVKATGSSTVQMWRTIPWRDNRTGPPFRRAEFTVASGIAKAVNEAEQLIWIFDQYFWSRSLAVQLHRQLRAKPDLRVIIVLPPHADDPSNGPHQHRARFEALTLLMNASGTSVADQVDVYSMWDSNPPAPEKAPGRGIYVHAKVQMYDGHLLVCGSANLNRRSLLCDAELAVAVADPAVVTIHQKQLWDFLFPAGEFPWPAPDFTQAGSGAKFFTAFRRASGAIAKGWKSPSRLILDPWDLDGDVLPGGAHRTRRDPGKYTSAYYDSALDPSSLDDACEAHHAGEDDNNSTWAPLDWVTNALETVVSPAKGSKPPRYPYRKQA